MKKQFRKIISVLLVCCFMLLTLSVSSFAYDNLFSTGNLTQWTTRPLYTTSPTITYTSSDNSNKLVFSNVSSGNYYMKYSGISPDSIYTDHTYKFSCYVWGNFTGVNLNIYAYIKYGNTLIPLLLTTVDQNLTSTSDYTYISGQFKLDMNTLNNLSDISSLEIELDFEVVSNITTRNLWVKDLYLIDQDSSQGFWNSVSDWFNRVYYSIVGGTDSQGVYHVGIVSGLTTALQTVKTGIINAIDGIEQWFVDLGEDIGEFFTMLKNYLLYFQHPVTLNSDGVPVDQYGEPIYENIFDIPDFFDTLEEWVEDLDDSKTDVNNAVTTGTQKIALLSGTASTLISGIPIIAVLITFGLAVIVIKKVLG